MVSPRMHAGGRRTTMGAVVLALLVAALLACAALRSVSAEGVWEESDALDYSPNDSVHQQEVEFIQPTLVEVESETELPACDGCFIEDAAEAESDAEEDDSESMLEQSALAHEPYPELMEMDDVEFAQLEQTLLSGHVLNQKWPGFLKSIARGVSHAVSSVAHKATSIARTVGRDVGRAAGAVRRGVGRVANTVRRDVGRVAGAVRRGVGRVARTVRRDVGRAAGAVRRGVGRIARGAGRLINKGRHMAGTLIRKAESGIARGARAIGNKARSIGRTIGRDARNFGRAVGRVGRRIGHDAANIGRRIGHDAANIGRAIGRGAKNFGRAVGRDAANIGKAIGRGAVKFGKGVAKVGKDFGKAAVTVGKDVVSFSKHTVGVVENVAKAGYHLEKTIGQDIVTAAKTAGSIVNHASKGQWNKIGGDVSNGAKQIGKQSMAGIKQLGGDAVAAAKDAEGMLQDAAKTIQDTNHMVEGPVFAATNAAGIGFINGPLDAALQTFEGSMTFGATSIISGAAQADTAAHNIYHDIQTGAGWKAIGLHALSGAAGVITAVSPLKAGGAMHTIGDKTIGELAKSGLTAARKAAVKSAEKSVVKAIVRPLGVPDSTVNDLYTIKGAVKSKPKETNTEPKPDAAPAAFLEGDVSESDFTEAEEEESAPDLLVSEKEALEIERELAHEDDDANHFRSFSEMAAQAVARTLDEAEVDPATLSSWVAAYKTDADVRAQLRVWVIQHAHESLSPAASAALAPLGLNPFPMQPEGFLFVESILGPNPLNSVQLSTLRAMITKSPIQDPFRAAIKNRVVSAARRVQAVHTYMMHVLKAHVNATVANATEADGTEAAAELLAEKEPLLKALEASFKQARTFLQLRATKLHVPVDLKHNKLLKKKPHIHHKYMRKRQAHNRRKAQKREAKRAAKAAAKLKAKRERALTREQKIAEIIRGLSKKEQEKLAGNSERDSSLQRDKMRRDITRGKSAKFRKSLAAHKLKQAAEESAQAKAKAEFKIKAARKAARKAAKRAAKKAAAAAKRRHAKGHKAFQSLKARKAADALQQEIARLALEAKHLAKTESDLRKGQRPLRTAHVIEDGLGDGRLEDGYTRNVLRPDPQAQKAFDAMVSAVMPEAEAAAGNIQQQHLDDAIPLMARALKVREQFQDFKEEMKATRATPDGWPNQEYEAEEIEE